MEANRNLPWKVNSICHLIYAGILLFAGLTGCAPKEEESTPQNNWKLFSSKAGRFSALLPRIPNEKVVSKQTPVGEIIIHNFIVETDIQTAYGVMYSDYPAKMDLSDSEKLFDEGQKAVAGEKGKIINSQPIKFENYPGREFEFQPGGKANYSGQVKLILVNHRYYQVVTIFLTANPHPAESKMFFDRFSLGKN